MRSAEYGLAKVMTVAGCASYNVLGFAQGVQKFQILWPSTSNGQISVADVEKWPAHGQS
jgi:hypothetical protein